MTSDSPIILIAHSDLYSAMVLRLLLNNFDFDGRIAGNSKDAIALLQAEEFTAVLLDEELSGGRESVVAAARLAHVPVVLASHNTTEKLSARGQQDIHRIKKDRNFLTQLPRTLKRVCGIPVRKKTAVFGVAAECAQR